MGVQKRSRIGGFDQAFAYRDGLEGADLMGWCSVAQAPRIRTMAETTKPPCGLYRTVADVGEIQAGRLVYFHNHGDPGPGIFLPSSWHGNRARFEGTGPFASI